MPDADAGAARRCDGASAPGFDRHRLAGAERRDHGVSLEGSAGAEGPHHQPGAHFPEAAPVGVSPLQGAAQAELARSYGVSQSTISRLAAPGPFEASAVGA